MSCQLDDEVERIRAEYVRREQEIGQDFYSLSKPANLFIYHGQQRALRDALGYAGMFPLADRRVLDVGCGHGQWLATFEAFGAQRINLAGVDLDAERAEYCAQQFTAADIRTGNAVELPWADDSFDIVFQSTVFTSILSAKMKQEVAHQMQRVLKSDGCIAWYDFIVNNPRNPNVQGIGLSELASLFPDYDVRRRRVTLAPPLARRLVPLSWTLCAMLEELRILNTHYFAVLRRRRNAAR